MIFYYGSIFYSHVPKFNYFLIILIALPLDHVLLRVNKDDQIREYRTTPTPQSKEINRERELTGLVPLTPFKATGEIKLRSELR